MFSLNRKVRKAEKVVVKYKVVFLFVLLFVIVKLIDDTTHHKYTGEYCAEMQSMPKYKDNAKLNKFCNLKI